MLSRSNLKLCRQQCISVQNGVKKKTWPCGFPHRSLQLMVPPFILHSPRSTLYRPNEVYLFLLPKKSAVFLLPCLKARNATKNAQNKEVGEPTASNRRRHKESTHQGGGGVVRPGLTTTEQDQHKSCEMHKVRKKKKKKKKTQEPAYEDMSSKCEMEFVRNSGWVWKMHNYTKY